MEDHCLTNQRLSFARTESSMRSMASITTFYLGENHGISLRTGTGSMAETTAGDGHSNSNDGNLCIFEDD